MTRLICWLLVAGFCSCQRTEPKIENIEAVDLTQEQIDSILTQFKFQYENPIVLDSGNHIMIPISTELPEGKRSFSKDGYYTDEFPRYRNILFYNRFTGGSSSLTTKKFRISDLYVVDKPGPYENNKALPGKILYEISDIDYNQDGKLNSKDPTFLFVSELDGSALQRISPLNEDLVYYEVIKEDNELIFETRRDINSDFVFNHEDEFVWYRSKMVSNEWENTEMIDSLNRKKIEKLYFDRWLGKEQ